jgi:hypothetical protein
MNSDMDKYLEHVDRWKLKVHTRLKQMTAAQRRAFWNQIHEEARAQGLSVVEPEKPAKRPSKRARRTG